MEKIIEATDISKIYGSHYVGKNVTNNPIADVFQAKIAEVINKVPTTVALDHVDLTVHRGDFVCIMGPSGSGKTTLLNAISTIDPPTKGKVLIEGKNIKKMGDIEIGNFRHQYLGFIFQKFNLLENLTVFENIAIPLTIAKTSDKEIETRIFDIADKVGIKELLDKYPTECSGGQCQRVAIARALITNPKLIVADEPTGNLDSKNSHEILQLLKKLNKEEGVTILMVTHDSMIASYAKRLLFIMDGKIAQVLDRGDMKQKEFYHQIMEITSHEAMELLEDEE
ncbi:MULTISPECIES: ABC transporter ATP-binding protein [Bacillota]|jgi:putative ABC transport system ATP-binding protein|uniref:ABC transporter ATP-binding protein n=2 Tax=Amedibacillus TaxID=2749846 RepID=A0A7G9GS06_9FIRM|nr:MULTISPECIES: ABC transporter ATP-binding protein [Bacillota]QNM13588.1 ABC transporter ATP-binding protein [[Eubacterium] hominis]MCH4283532.1 ABC transporter ATP-binding protein [Amedibacillus hominis]RGB54992.1 ABC transporter ATP-binding protein [Absiella sp. AM10-20]RGB56564.1 ABC transporter ATP-binding protein [Absiella sp. AM22-9]RGB68600.1 ABC transporter ATP-binding protein [Absiella sp. AM09-45]